MLISANLRDIFNQNQNIYNAYWKIVHQLIKWKIEKILFDRKDILISVSSWKFAFLHNIQCKADR
jgi:hypothetical protein